MSGAIGRTTQVLLSAGSMRSRADNPIQTAGFYLAGFLSVVLAVLKLTAMVDWSWWRVMLPVWVFSVHNAAYILVGFICLFFAKYGEEEEKEEQPIDQTNLLVGYQFAALLFSLELDRHGAQLAQGAVLHPSTPIHSDGRFDVSCGGPGPGGARIHQGFVYERWLNKI